MAKKTVFLSGSIEGISIQECSAWRYEAGTLLRAAGFEIYDPTEAIKKNPGYIFSPNEVLVNNSHYLYLSDIILVNMDLPATTQINEAPFFTVGEMFLAHYAKKPVITFGQAFKERKSYEAIVTKNLSTLAAAVDYIINFY